MAGKLTIPKQDKRPAQNLELNLPANIVARLKAYADDNEHDVDYVVAHVLDEALPPEEAKKPDAAKPMAARRPGQGSAPTNFKEAGA